MSDWISDFTPDIEWMRGSYQETWFYAPHTNSTQEKNAEFDRFLELVKQEERERIIKLLNSELSKFMWANVDQPSAALSYAHTLSYAMKLIKEETK